MDRIFAQRKNETGGQDFYVKWKNLPYSEATWEDETVVTNYYSPDLKVGAAVLLLLLSRVTSGVQGEEEGQDKPT